ncbi:MAG: TIGR02757 family protein [Synergistaceae bacterium]|nr:TIGR02757 family protein [Synergistota bacterium]NLM71867.1 TIGR02757 family protein [Synergistaceae bacterium]
MSVSAGIAALGRALPHLEEAYARLNRREYVSPDPLETLYRYEYLADREVAALLVSCISYGRVAMILRSARTLLGVLGDHPAEFLVSASQVALGEELRPFRHRFTTGEEVASLMVGIGRVIREYGSLEELMAASLERGVTPIEGAVAFVEKLRAKSELDGKHLLPSPADGSACKRLFLFLKWMVRSDEVDPGGWSALHPRDLLLPMDVHMFDICKKLGLTSRNQANLRASIEVTDLFRTAVPEDPTKFDFVITRFGIRKELDKRSLVELCLG